MGRKKKNKTEENNEEIEKKPLINLEKDTKRNIIAVIVFVVAIISALGFFKSAGSFGEFVNRMIAYSIGWMKFVFPVFLIIFAVLLLIKREISFYISKITGLVFVLLGFTGIFHWFYDSSEMLKKAGEGNGGGYIGYAMAYFLEKYLGSAGSLVVLLAIVLLGIILAFNFSFINFFEKFKKEKKNDDLGEVSGNNLSLEKKEDDSNEGEEKENEVEESNVLNEADGNIGNIKFVNGRDQFDSSKNENENFSEPDFLRKKIALQKPIDLSSESNQVKEDITFRRYKSSRWTFPPKDLLDKSYGIANSGDIERNFEIIKKTLKDFGIEVEKGEAKTGPSVTQYSFRPAVGVKISKILSFQDDLSLALAAHPIRIEAPIPGQSLIGIEIPNKSSLTVKLRDMLEEGQFKKRSSNLSLFLGKDVSGNCIFGDLSKMPHLMIAGSTGTGKSVCANSIITALLYQNSPNDLKFIMIDPKRVELSLYNGIPHLLTEVIVENKKVVNVLKWAVGEMEKRYRLLQDVGTKDIASYEEKRRAGEKIKHTDPESGEISEEDLKKLPYVVIVIDELADIMISYGKEVEGAIVRIAQMARAVGIHLIVSTQRPSVEVITGLIKANIATRIAFQVATQIDSRTILDMGGAEKLLGNGDMLYRSARSPKPKRIQGAFISEEEVKRVVKFIKDQKFEKKEEIEKEEVKNSQEEILEFKSNDSEGEDGELLKTAREEIIRSKKASASFLQRRLRIGYARAARILDILEEQGVVGPADGAKPREIYGLKKEESVDYSEPLEDQEKRDKWQT
jgi:DNA segregation ATPase FtsK/SpoIIIE, S-DNA-T family